MKRCQESIHCGTNSNFTEARGRASVEWAMTGLISSPEFVIQWIGPIFKSLACPICAVGGDGVEKRHIIIKYVAICNVCVVLNILTDGRGASDYDFPPFIKISLPLHTYVRAKPA